MSSKLDSVSECEVDEAVNILSDHKVSCVVCVEINVVSTDTFVQTSLQSSVSY